jgi:hypothetical protein
MKDIHQKEAVLHPRKLDWMLLHKRNDIKKIMRDNASFIQFPKMGTESNQIIVYAENQVNVERTLRSLHFLVQKKILSEKKNVLISLLRLVESMKLVSILIIVIFMVSKTLQPFYLIYQV